MTVYLGSDGRVELKRSSSQAIVATVGTADVNPERGDSALLRTLVVTDHWRYGRHSPQERKVRPEVHRGVSG